MMETGHDASRVSARGIADLSASFDHAPWAVVELSPEAHVVHYANSLFCNLLGKTTEDVVGSRLEHLLPPSDQCLERLNRVFLTGKAESFIAEDDAAPLPLLYSYALWPVVVHDRTAGVMIQVNETGPLHAARQAISQALLIGALHQDEIIEAAEVANTRLRLEVLMRTKAEHDARLLNSELSHRVKNNLAVVSALIANEMRHTPEPWLQGFRALQTRVLAIARLYDVMSQSEMHQTIDLAVYLREIANGLSESILYRNCGVRIAVEAEPVQINSERAVPLGLLVNELSTNALKHAFPKGLGKITLSISVIGGEIELKVADDGIGMAEDAGKRVPGKHGADYVAIFVSQLEGIITRVTNHEQGTTFTVRFPAKEAVTPRTSPA